MPFDSSSRELMIRCDADATMGYGHFYRQFALAQSAHDMGWYATLCTHASLPETLRAIARKEGIELLISDHERGSRDEANWLRDLTGSRDPEAVVIDGYHLDFDYIARAKDEAAIVFFEDDGTKRAPADLVVNLSPGSAQIDYSALPGSPEFALGPDYALLRRQFRAQRSARPHQTPEHVERVLITLGGGDMSEEVTITLSALAMAGYDERCDVMLGNVPEAALDALRAHAGAMPFEVSLHQSVQRVAELMSAQDLAICAAGGTSWELASLGIPMVQARLFDNQRLIAEHLSERGVTASLGTREDFEAPRIARHIERVLGDRALRETLSQRGRALIDGMGGRRLLERITRLA